MRTMRRAMATLVAFGMLAGLGLSGSALAQDASTSAGDEPLTFIVGLTNNIVTVNPFARDRGAGVRAAVDAVRPALRLLPGRHVRRARPRHRDARPRRTAASRPTASRGRSRSATT